MALRYNLEIAIRAGLDGAANRRRRVGAVGTTDLFLCVVDHFEPRVGGAKSAAAHIRMEDWMQRYPRMAAKHRDADGRIPAHSFFYPWDEYDAWEFERLAELCQGGWGEIEIHLHHRDDTEASLRDKFCEAIEVYSAQGALTRWPDGRHAWGFIHGNWALDNSRQENGRNFCGVNSEIGLLRELGCYADFTFPAWQQTAQPRLTNAIYYAQDDPARSKSHETGIPAQAGRLPSGDLLLIQGPLAPFWQGHRPAMDDGDLAHYRRYHPERLDRWVNAGIHVQGRPDRVFVKLHCHGAEDANRDALLGSDLDALFTDAETRYNDGKQFRLHYVTAREMFNLVRASETDPTGEIGAARDFLLKPPSR